MCRNEQVNQCKTTNKFMKKNNIFKQLWRDCHNILQPTRVTDNTATVIDNIFSNNIPG